MDLGMRDWLLIVGGLLILGVLGHGLWIAWKAKRSDVRVRYENKIPDLDLDDIDLLRAELPSGPARVVKADGQAEAKPGPRMARPSPEAVARSQQPRWKPKPARPTEAPPAGAMLDPIDQDLEREARAADVEDDVGVDRAESRNAKSRESRQEPVVRDAPKPSRERAPTPTPTADPAPEQAPLFAGDPIVSRDRAASRSARRKPAAETRKPTRDRRAAEPEPTADEAPEEDFDEVLVINVLRRDGAQMPGADLLEVVSEHGLRYGDMNIFHRYGAGQRIEFSMANAVKPGTFDLGAIDDLYTPGVSFFMRLPGPDQPLEAFDDMANVARDIAQRLQADLKDERHSVMTAQTLEHCRQRIREFRRRQMSRRN